MTDYTQLIESADKVASELDDFNSSLDRKARMVLRETAKAIEALQARCGVLLALRDGQVQHVEKAFAERDTALAELAKLREQEPVAYRYRFAHPISAAPVWRSEASMWNGQCLQEVQPLYAGPAAAQPKELTDEAIDCLDELCDIVECVVEDKSSVGSLIDSFTTQPARKALAKLKGAV